MSTIERDTQNSLQTHDSRHIIMTGDNGLPESYHLDGGNNFRVWTYMMKNLLQKNGRFHDCLTPPNKNMSEEEKMARQCSGHEHHQHQCEEQCTQASSPIPWPIRMLDQIEDHIWIWQRPPQSDAHRQFLLCEKLIPYQWMFISLKSRKSRTSFKKLMWISLKIS